MFILTSIEDQNTQIIHLVLTMYVHHENSFKHEQSINEIHGKSLSLFIRTVYKIMEK